MIRWYKVQVYIQVSIGEGWWGWVGAREMEAHQYQEQVNLSPFVTFYSNCSPSLGCVSTLRVEERRCHFHFLQIYGHLFSFPSRKKLRERVLPLYKLMINNSKTIFWNIVDLQCCVRFRCTAKWFNYTYIYSHIYMNIYSFIMINNFLNYAPFF